MRPLWLYPLSTFCDAAQSTVGWLLVMLGTSLLGLWLGAWLGLGELPGFDCILWGPVVLMLAVVVSPELLILYAFTVLLWYVPHRFESARLRVGAAVVNLLVWVCWCAWVSSSW